jgi:eukaryotic-like serine/threonine-protein kinase
MTQPRLVGGRYELGELIGYGGMAEVHRGRDTRLNRDVAIKVLRADLARDPSFLTRFRREAHSSAGLNHPSIVAVYDTGEDHAPDGTPVPFIVMEYVEGRTLRDILKSEGRLPARRAMEITADICAALDFSHRNGIVHRDIKPANVMITPTGAVKVMDFGIARAVADTSSTVTQTANVIGTAQYLSPEQARGEAVDARSDVYSTGCLLYELVTGVPPFQGDSPVAVAYQHVRENPVMPSARNPEVPRAIDSIVMKALAKNQYNRYQTAGEMRGDLQRALANQPVTAEAVMTDAERTQFIARTPPAAVPLRRPDEVVEDRSARRTGLIWAAVVVALLIVIGVAAYAIVFLGHDSKSVKKAEVPTLVNLTTSAANQQLRQAGFVPRYGGATSGTCDDNQTVAKGRVCTVSPATGQNIKTGSTVTYKVFSPALVQVPFVEGQSYDKAVALLQSHHLQAVKHSQSSTQPENQVLSQTPEGYKEVPPNSKVDLYVSTGKIKLPDVTGKSFDEARGTLNRDGFTKVVQDSQNRSTTDPKKDNKVAAEDPTPGITYSPSQQVTLTLYHYSPPPPTCTTPPKTPSPPVTPPASSSSSTSTNPLPPCTSTPAGGKSS